MNQKEINNILAKARPFRYLNEKQLKSIMAYGQLLDFASGKTILSQGKLGDGLYVLLDGKANVSVRVLGEGKIKLAQLSRGSFFGELNLLETKPCSATVKAIKKTTCYFLKKQFYDNFVIGMLPERHAINRALIEDVIVRQARMGKAMKAKVARVPQQNKKNRARTKNKKQGVVSSLAIKSNKIYADLFSLPMFQFFTQEEFNRLFKGAKLKKTNDPCDLAKKDKVREACYFVLSGSVQVCIHAKAKKSKLCVHGPNTLICPPQVEAASFDGFIYRTTGAAQWLEFSASYLRMLAVKDKTLWYKFYDLFCRYIVAFQGKLNTQTIRLENEKFESLIVV